MTARLTYLLTVLEGCLGDNVKLLPKVDPFVVSLARRFSLLKDELELSPSLLVIVLFVLLLESGLTT